MTKPDDWVPRELDHLRERDLERTLSVYPEVGGVLHDVGKRYLNLSSNDYLSLTGHPLVQAASREALVSYGTGAGASRLVSGTLPIHEELEAALARLKGYPAALLFGSGYLANLGCVTSLVGRNDTVFADRLIHASLIDAVVLSRARLMRFRHNDLDHLDQLLRKSDRGGRRLVLTESVFSMDGDLAPLEDLAALCDRHGALLMVDEAHATGLFGPDGAGLIQQKGLCGRIGVSIATLSKGLGTYGGMVACSSELRQWFINKARSLIYSTALPPAVVGAGLGAVRVLREEPHRGKIVLSRAARFRHRFEEEGLDTLQSASQIVPVVVGDAGKTLRLAAKLLQAGILAVAIRPPTVPAGTSRLRLSVTYAHTDDDLAQAAETIIRLMRET